MILTLFDHKTQFLLQGSAFRCLKIGDSTDALLEKAARASGLAVEDVLENLPSELAIWIDPGEVSYRIGEKGYIKVKTQQLKLLR